MEPQWPGSAGWRPALMVAQRAGSRSGWHLHVIDATDDAALIDLRIVLGQGATRRRVPGMSPRGGDRSYVDRLAVGALRALRHHGKEVVPRPGPSSARGSPASEAARTATGTTRPDRRTSRRTAVESRRWQRAVDCNRCENRGAWGGYDPAESCGVSGVGAAVPGCGHQLARHLTGQGCDAADLVQEIYVRAAWRSELAVGGPSPG